MKRHPFLISLSREHHRGLVLARRAARWAGSDSATRSAAWTAVRAAFEAELEPHFRDEELRLLPRLDGARDDLVSRTRGDHERLRHLALHGRGPGDLRAFGELLKEHIRFEERQLFPAIEATLEPLEAAR